MLHSAANAMARHGAHPPFELRLESGTMAVRDALHETITHLSKCDLPDPALGTIELVLAEVLNNVVEHACASDEADSAIVISCRMSGNKVHFRVVDQGVEMPDGTLPKGEPAVVDTEFDDLPEGGFGWFLIKELASEVRYRRFACFNELTFWVSTT